ncbi:putative ribonuclease H-like domain-containing protein [Tanacetum coccineum]
MTAPSTSSTNHVNNAMPAYEVSTASPDVNTASPQVSTTSFSDSDVYAFMVENPSGSNILQQDLEQIHEDDLEAMDLKWQLSLINMREKRYYQRTGKKIFINANDTAGYDKSKVECFNYHKIGHFARECKAPKSKEGQFKNQDNTRKQGNNEDTSSKTQSLKRLRQVVRSQITDKSKKGLGYNRPKKLDPSYSSLDEFKEHEFKGYGSEVSKKESNVVCDKKSDNFKENSDNYFSKRRSIKIHK